MSGRKLINDCFERKEGQKKIKGVIKRHKATFRLSVITVSCEL